MQPVSFKFENAEVLFDGSMFSWKNVKSYDFRDIKVEILLSKMKLNNALYIQVNPYGKYLIKRCKAVKVDDKTYYKLNNTNRTCIKYTHSTDEYVIPNTTENYQFATKLVKKAKQLTKIFKKASDDIDDFMNLVDKEISERDSTLF